MKIEDAFSRALAEEARTILWRDTGCNLNDPSTWAKPVVRLGLYAHGPFGAAANTATLHRVRARRRCRLALYIVLRQRAGRAHGTSASTRGTLIAALLVVPVGLADAGHGVLAPSVLPLGFAVAVFSSALPIRWRWSLSDGCRRKRSALS